jgi:hypothetical protein
VLALTSFYAFNCLFEKLSWRSPIRLNSTYPNEFMILSNFKAYFNSPWIVTNPSSLSNDLCWSESLQSSLTTLLFLTLKSQCFTKTSIQPGYLLGAKLMDPCICGQNTSTIVLNKARNFCLLRKNNLKNFCKWRNIFCHNFLFQDSSLKWGHNVRTKRLFNYHYSLYQRVQLSNTFYFLKL